MDDVGKKWVYRGAIYNEKFTGPPNNMADAVEILYAPEMADLHAQLTQCQQELEQWRDLEALQHEYFMQAMAERDEAKAISAEYIAKTDPILDRFDKLTEDYDALTQDRERLAKENNDLAKRKQYWKDGAKKLNEQLQQAEADLAALRAAVDDAVKKWRAQTNAQEGISFKLAMRRLEGIRQGEGG